MLQAPQSQTLDAAFEALKRFKPGDDPEALVPIDRAVMDVHGNAAARAALEQRLVEYLGTGSSPPARAFVCRELAVIGSGSSVPSLAPLLTNEELSHMARYALERIPGVEADTALREAIATTKGKTRVGVIHSVGVRRDARSVPILTKVLTQEPDAAAAAAKALGEAGTPEAAKALEAARGKGSAELRLAVADGSLICAGRLIATGHREQAVKLLEGLTDDSQAPHVRHAAKRALSAAMRPS